MTPDFDNKELTREPTKKYKKEFSHSYALGPFPTFELLSCAPELALHVYIDERFNEREKLIALCEEKNVPYSFATKALARISDKEVCYAAAAFKKQSKLLEDSPAHIVLVSPADMGNLGTIIRTSLAFSIKDIAVIEPSADIWSPRVVRASMGAIFRLRVASFQSFEEYHTAFESRDVFPFMTDGGTVLTPQGCPKSESFSLVFGNESSGLPHEFQSLGRSVFIQQSDEVDSLNLSVSVAIGAYIFTDNNRR